MRAGKDVMVDKPGVTTPRRSSRAVEAGRRARPGASSRSAFPSASSCPSTIVAGKLIADGAIGRVVQTIGLGPHRLNRAIRPDWFFDASGYGGILTDIASHQIDQFLHFTGSDDAEIVASGIGHFGEPDLPDFEDFGEILLRSGRRPAAMSASTGSRADGLPTWGDGRLTILGTEGTIELRKYVDIAGRPGTDHVFLVDEAGTRHIDASREPLTYFRELRRRCRRAHARPR